MQTTRKTPGNRNTSRALLESNVQGILARLDGGDGVGYYADVTRLTKRDVVVAAGSHQGAPRPGDVVRVALLTENEAEPPQIYDGIVHWQQTVDDRKLTAMFLTDEVGCGLLARIWDDRRSEARFPTTLQVSVTDDKHSMPGRLSNYSLNGVCVHTAEQLETDREYEFVTRNRSGGNRLFLHATPHWSIETSYGYVAGCTLRADEGVLLATYDLEQPVLPWELIHRESSRDSDRTLPETAMIAAQARHNLLRESPGGSNSRALTFLRRASVIVSLLTGTLALATNRFGLAALSAIVALAAFGWQCWSEARRDRVRLMARATAQAKLEERVRRTCAASRAKK